MFWRNLATQTRWRPVLLVTAVAVGVVAFAAGSGSASTSGVKGAVTLQPVTGPSCLSAVDICFTGTISGKIKGTVSGTGTSLVQTVDTPATGVVLLTSDLLVTTSDGTLSLKDADVLRTTGASEMSGVWTVIGGTGLYAGATGALQVTGNFTVTSGGSLKYVGSLTF
jgi:hypothetical protein